MFTISAIAIPRRSWCRYPKVDQDASVPLRLSPVWRAALEALAPLSVRTPVPVRARQLLGVMSRRWCGSAGARPTWLRALPGGQGASVVAEAAVAAGDPVLAAEVGPDGSVITHHRKVADGSKARRCFSSVARLVMPGDLGVGAAASCSAEGGLHVVFAQGEQTFGLFLGSRAVARPPSGGSPWPSSVPIPAGSSSTARTFADSGEAMREHRR